MVNKSKILSDLSKMAVDAMGTFSGIRKEVEVIVGLRVNKIINKRTGMVRYMRKQNVVFKMPMWVEVKDNPLSSVLKS